MSKLVRPLISSDFTEARRRALGLYRAIFRYIPYIVKYYDIPKNEEDCRWKLRECFYKNACIKDIRVVDLLVLKGFMELEEITQLFHSKSTIMHYWHPTVREKPSTFMSKFYAGID